MANIYDDTVHQTVDVETSSTDVLEKDTRRNFLILQNDSDTDMYISFGVDAGANSGILLPSKGNLVLDNAILTASVSAIHSGTGTKRLLVTVA